MARRTSRFLLWKLVWPAPRSTPPRHSSPVLPPFFACQRAADRMAPGKRMRRVGAPPKYTHSQRVRGTLHRDRIHRCAGLFAALQPVARILCRARDRRHRRREHDHAPPQRREELDAQASAGRRPSGPRVRSKVLPVRHLPCIYISDRTYIQGVEANGTVYHIDQAR